MRCEVFLEAFEGPLDLLLYLIRRQNLDILDIPIAEITRQYMKYIELMQELQLELAGEYLVMAATLAEIKSRMLLPRPQRRRDEEDDPRAELVRRLQEYERFKRAAEDIDELPRARARHVRSPTRGTDRAQGRQLHAEVTLQEMLVALQGRAGARGDVRAPSHQREPLSVRERMSEVLGALRDVEAFVEFVQLFRPEEGRMGVTVTFVAILELLREGLIEIVQAEAYAPIHVRPGSGAPN